MALSATVELINGPPDTVEIGKPFSAWFRVSNHGNEVLTPGRDKLGSWNPQDNTLWGDTRAALAGPIAPGQGDNFEVKTFVGQQVGTHPFQWRMMREGVAWYGVAHPAKAITVVAGGGAPPTPGPTPPPSPGGEALGIWPAKRKDAFDLLGCMIVNTGAFAADGRARRVDWVNRTGERLRICASRIWLGVVGGGKCDAHGQLERSDGSLVSVLQADHYVDGPHGAAIERQDYSGGYLAIEPGEALVFVYFANGFTGGCQAHFTVSVWGLYG